MAVCLVRRQNSTKRLFQPFLRFWHGAEGEHHRVGLDAVSTLLEILGGGERPRPATTAVAPVSTLLEILGLVYSVLVGF